jgi:hypothetical protein
MVKPAEVYELGGITLLSDLPLPELPRLQPQALSSQPATVRLVEGIEPPDGMIEVAPGCLASASRYSLRIPGLAAYQVNHGSEILVSPEPGALPLDVRAYLLATLFIVLCQQRGLLPLHASAISNGDGVVAFVARSGQGKSSLAAHLFERGFTVVGDDVCLINTELNPAMVVPVAPWLKLWRNSLETLGKGSEGLQRVFSEDDKYRLPLNSKLESQPIRRLVFLESVDLPAPVMEEVTAIEAIPLLMDLTHQAYLLEATGQRQQSFLRCSRIASQARSYRLLRPWGLSHLDETLDLLENFLRR